MKKFLSLLLLLFPLIGFADDAEFYDGIHYTEINPVAPLTNTGKIEVVEVFWYACPHCFRFEPHVTKWKATLADDVVFERIPGVLSKHWILLAKVFYAANILGVEEKMTPIIFNNIHQHNARMNKIKDAEALFVANGVSAEDFNQAIKSFAVNTKVGQAKSLNKRYGLSGVPTIIVDGRYRVDSGAIGSFEKVIEITDFLVNMVRESRLK